MILCDKSIQSEASLLYKSTEEDANKTLMIVTVKGGRMSHL